MYHIMLKSPPPIPNIIYVFSSPGAKDEKISLTNKKVNPKIPTKAFVLLNTLPHSITIEIVIPAISPRENPIKVPGTWLLPTESIDCPAVVIIDCWASVTADAY